MSIFWAIILGIVQGVTEFIPVSSSGHLVIIQSLMPAFVQPGVLFDVVLHLGTVFAVLFFFRKTIISLVRKYWILFIIGTIPAGLVGLFFQDQLEALFGSVKFVGFALLVTAVFNFITDKTISYKKEITNRNAFMIGVFQALAIIPGISRSGATIFAGVKSGIDKEKAAEFSFLLSIPAILGANVLQFVSHGINGISDPLYYLFGYAAASVSGFISIGFVLKALHKKRFKLFSIYCLVLGLAVLLI